MDALTADASFPPVASVLMPKLSDTPLEAEVFDVIIVGAGVSGLAAAAALPTNLRVAIIDARNRIGGRVDTIKIGGFEADLGPAWLHGGTGNATTTASTATSSTLSSSSSSPETDYSTCENSAAAILPRHHTLYPFPSTGNPWLMTPAKAMLHISSFINNRDIDSSSDTSISPEAEEEAWFEFLKHCSKVSATKKGATLSFGQVALEKFSQLPIALAVRLAWRARAAAAWNGCSPIDAPLAYFTCVPSKNGGDFGDFAGSHALPLGGTSSVVSALCAAAKRPPALRLSRKVTHITYNDVNGVVEINAIGGVPLRAQAVLLTLPVWLLRACVVGETAPLASSIVSLVGSPPPPPVLFSPPFPQSKIDVLQRNGVVAGSCKKVVFAWKEQWWPKTWPPFIAPHQSASSISGGSGGISIIENYASLKGIPLLVCYFIGDDVWTAPETMPRHSSPDNNAVLAALLGMPVSKTSTKSPGRVRTPAEAVATALEALSQVAIAEGFSPFPPYSDARVSEWENDEFAGYGAWARETSTLDEGDVLELAKPIANRLFFAGDGFDEEHLGSLHGAIASGRRAADEIATRVFS
jgi:monoamine oxidase